MTTPRRSASSLQEVALGVKFLWNLPGLLRRPFTVEDGSALVRARLDRREADFLALARGAIFGNPASPYLALLGQAGCTYGDLERLVRQAGLDGALATLHRQGVYLTIDEFKGRQPVVRGSASFDLNPSGLRNPNVIAHVARQTSGSRGAPTPVPVDLRHVRDRALLTGVPLALRGGAKWHKAVLGIPGSSLVTLLQYSMFGTPARWFLEVDPAAPGLHARYRWSARALRWGSLLAGATLPRPRTVRRDDYRMVVDWLAATLAAGSTPHLDSSASAAVHLCQTALAVGIDLRGAQLSVGREPLTAAGLAAIERSGARAVPRYSASESGPLGSGCLNPTAADEVHFHLDAFALVQPGADGAGGGLSAQALLLTTFRAAAPLVLLNVSFGDQAELVRRRCGCPLEQLGWSSHLHTIRSFEKLTAGGMTFLDSDLIRVLDSDLPTRFGGGPTDYQLVEDEDAAGAVRLRLLVHPRVGPLDEQAVRDAFLAAIGRGSGAERLMALQWRDAGLPRIERRPPLPTAAGKLLHLHRANQLF